MEVDIDKKDIRQFSEEALKDTLVSMGEPGFRAKQISEWLWKKGATEFEQMTNLSKPLREKLEAGFVIPSIELDKIQHSNDGTIKSRFRLADGNLIESVLIPVPDDKRFTVCVSTQVGCSLSCKFCATTNSSACEIWMPQKFLTVCSSKSTIARDL
ncbi:MAG: hypothetical protein R2769_16530 [Saprospiraceae bacterium]